MFLMYIVSEASICIIKQYSFQFANSFQLLDLSHTKHIPQPAERCSFASAILLSAKSPVRSNSLLNNITSASVSNPKQHNISEDNLARLQ